MRENELSHEIIGAAIEVHRCLGPGLLEGAYEAALAYELSLRGMAAARQVKQSARYKEIELPDSYRLDLVVDDLVIVELKAVERLLAVHEVQLLTYLRFANKRLGLLINFNVAVLKGSIRRVVNQL